MDSEIIQLHENQRQMQNLMEYQTDAYMEVANDNQSETSEVDGSDIKVPTGSNIFAIQRGCYNNAFLTLNIL